MLLTNEQKEMIRNVVRDVKQGRQVITCSGYAGTGKTVCINTLSKAMPNFCICAYTGKAANVLRKKGLSGASTIHSTIYRPYKDFNNETVWQLASAFDIPGLEGFIVDEASMIGTEIDRDLQSFGKPIIYVGDHGQLEPIGGTKFNLMAEPMYKLETVHRNAGEIAHFAEHLRKGLNPRLFPAEKAVQIVKEKVVTAKNLADTDQVICAYNKTRVKLNNQVRKEKGIEYTFIAIGEKIMCLRNNRVLQLFNGMQGTVTKIRKNDRFDFTSDGQEYSQIHYDPDQFGQETNKFEYGSPGNPFDYAYAITCHKSQGDEWNNVIVYEQKCDKWEHKRWAYTAASRAKRGLVWIESENYIPSYLK